MMHSGSEEDFVSTCKGVGTVTKLSTKRGTVVACGGSVQVPRAAETTTTAATTAAAAAIRLGLLSLWPPAMRVHARRHEKDCAGKYEASVVTSVETDYSVSNASILPTPCDLATAESFIASVEQKRRRENSAAQCARCRYCHAVFPFAQTLRYLCEDKMYVCGMWERYHRSCAYAAAACAEGGQDSVQPPTHGGSFLSIPFPTCAAAHSVAHATGTTAAANVCAVVCVSAKDEQEECENDAWNDNLVELDLRSSSPASSCFRADEGSESVSRQDNNGAYDAVAPASSVDAVEEMSVSVIARRHRRRIYTLPPTRRRRRRDGGTGSTLARRVVPWRASVLSSKDESCMSDAIRSATTRPLATCSAQEEKLSRIEIDTEMKQVEKDDDAEGDVNDTNSSESVRSGSMCTHATQITSRRCDAPSDCGKTDVCVAVSFDDAHDDADELLVSRSMEVIDLDKNSSAVPLPATTAWTHKTDCTAADQSRKRTLRERVCEKPVWSCEPVIWQLTTSTNAHSEMSDDRERGAPAAAAMRPNDLVHSDKYSTDLNAENQALRKGVAGRGRGRGRNARSSAGCVSKSSNNNMTCIGQPESSSVRFSEACGSRGRIYAAMLDRRTMFASSEEQACMARYVMSNGKLRHECPDPYQFLSCRSRELRNSIQPSSL